MRDYKIILASNSPRRKELLSGLGINYEVQVFPDVDESYPSSLVDEEIALFVAKKKAEAHKALVVENTLLITADTIVLLDGEVYGKPKDEADARRMLHHLSGKLHKVITGVCLTSKEKQRSFTATSEVLFSKLEDEEIAHYVSTYKPMDKAGAYGIQEWIGYIAVEKIVGSYFNIMGLPIQRLYQELKQF